MDVNRHFFKWEVMVHYLLLVLTLLGNTGLTIGKINTQGIITRYH